jgi:hypothetical protein
MPPKYPSPRRTLLIRIIAFAGFVWIIFSLLRAEGILPPSDGGVVACPADVMICPDGSGVGRVAPSCAFAPCPAGSNAITPFKNPLIANAIEQYLLTQIRFSWETRPDSYRQCAVFPLDHTEALFPISVWVVCGEYVFEGDTARMVSGSSGPALVAYPNELSFYDPARFTHEAPRDGAFYDEDIARIFSPVAQEGIVTLDRASVTATAGLRAEEAFRAWNAVVVAIKNCEVESVMQAHSREVSARLKDGSTLRAIEPRIDDIIDVADVASASCGKIRMATE